MTAYRILSTTLGILLSERIADTPMEALTDFARAHGFTGYHAFLVDTNIDPSTIEIRVVHGDARDDDDLIRCTCCGGLFLIGHRWANFHSHDGAHFHAHCPLCAEGSPVNQA